MTSLGQNLKINGDRLWESLMEMAKVGPGIAGGNNRQTLTDEDAEGRALFQKWCEDAGCTMGLDQMGNMFARREGTDPDRERRYGYSVAGAQKFDLLCTYNKEPIEQILSRGQQKLFLISLVFAQSNLVATLTGNKPLVLIDDIGAELDDSAKVRFATAIGKIDSQLLITAINEDAISNVSSILDNYKMFHVEHGVISEN